MHGLNLEQVLQVIRGLPRLPETHTRVIALANDPLTSTSEIARAVNTDTGLAAQVLQLANTPFYGMNGRIDSVARAVVTLGVRVVCSLATGAGMVQTLEGHDPRKQCGIDIWRHCLQTAVAARSLAEDDGTIDPDLAFTGGLLHDMGKLVLAVLFPEPYQDVLTEHANTGIPLIELENQFFGIDHAQVGAVLCETWCLPATLQTIIEHHHTPPVSRDVGYMVACGSVLARLVTPHASGEIHVRESELAGLIDSTPRVELLRRLVVSQSMQPPAPSNEQAALTVLVDCDRPAIREAIHLVSLTCGFTPLSSRDDQ
ncbi:MAG: HDOD domain-containing protein, partial [Planctomycetaceae bacterium]